MDETTDGPTFLPDVADEAGARRRLAELASLEAEDRRLRDQARAQRDDVAAWLADVTAGLGERIEMVRRSLTSYAWALGEDLGVGRSKSRKYPTGVIGKRKRPDRVVFVDVDEGESTFVDWAIANQRLDLLTITPSASALTDAVRVGDQPGEWTDELFAAVKVDKKGDPVSDAYGQAVPICDADGAIVPGVHYLVGDEEFYARPKAVDR